MGILLTQSGGIFGPIAKLLGHVMNFIYEYLGVHNIGLCIILFTIIIYTLMLPLTIKQQKSSRMMAIINPELQAIQNKYKNKKDQASITKMQEETRLVYEKYGTSPTGGCLGSLIQLPILFALWPIIRNIPAYVGGVKDAYMPLVEKIMATDGYVKIMEKIGEAKPILINADKYSYKEANTLVDVLYKFQKSNWDTLVEKFPDLSEIIEKTQESIHEMNYFLGINIAETPSSMLSAVREGIDFSNFSFGDLKVGLLIAAIAIPLLAGVTQWINARVAQSATNRNKKQNDENAMAQQMDMMMKIMPVMSIVMCFSMPAGLGIYWITSAVIRTIQQFIINKVLDKKSVDDMVKTNMEKAAKKNEKKKSVSSKLLNEMAQSNTKNIDEPKKKITSKNVSSEKEVNSYKSSAKPGSLASRANMVSDFNNRNK